MSDKNIIELNESYNREMRSILHDAEHTLKGGGGGGTFDGMDARVSALEATSKRIEEKLDKLIDKTSKIEIDVARLDGKVSTLPTTLQLLGFVVAVLAIAGLAKYLAP